MSDIHTIAADMEVLGGVEPRYACTDGERAMLDAVRARLPADTTSRVEGFVGHPLPLLVLGLHGIFLTLSGLVGVQWPTVGLICCLLVGASLVGEGTGRLGMLRWWLVRMPSYNLVVPPPQPGTLGTIVLTTPLDVPHWRAWRPRALRRPLQAVFLSAAAMVLLLLLRALAEPWGRALIGVYSVSLGVTAFTGALLFVARREPRGVEADAGGVAAVLEVHRRLLARPLDGVGVWVVFTGCGHAHQDGVAAFLTLRGQRLPEPILVLSVNEAGKAPLQAVVTEGPLWPQHHRATGPALVERLYWAGVRIPEVDRPDPTDARAAMLLGYRALAFSGGTSAPSPDAALRAADIVETVLRWYRADLARLPEDRSALTAMAAGEE